VTVLSFLQVSGFDLQLCHNFLIYACVVPDGGPGQSTLEANVKLFSISALALAAGLAAAGAQAQDWGGFYAGLSVTNGDSGLDFPGLPSPYSESDSAALGMFVGYNHVLTSNLVLGAELSKSDFNTEKFPPISPFYGDGLLQLRGRVGYAAGNVMPYLALGLARTDVGIVGGPSTSEKGYSIGIGTEFMVGSSMSLRAEYNRATFKDVGENVFFPPDFADMEYETFTFGAAWHF
jgi:outer membrane immunogenic protein